MIGDLNPGDTDFPSHLRVQGRQVEMGGVYAEMQTISNVLLWASKLGMLGECNTTF